MRGGEQNSRDLVGSVAARERPWKSGPSRAASRIRKMETAFRPRLPGLKPSTKRRQRGAEAPLFHGCAGGCAGVAVQTLAVFVAILFATPAHAQVTFDRLLNS